MANNSIEESKRKKKNRNRFLILLLIYFMLIGTAVGITSGIKDNKTVVAICVIAGITVIYWMAFYIVIRRQNQKGN